MSTAQVISQTGEAAGSIELNPALFEAEIKDHLFYDVVRMQLANRRRATYGTKTRSLVSGGGAKPYRQKGTGRARQGSTRSPHFRGGGVVFGPNGRKYQISLPKKVRRAALRSAIAKRWKDGKLVILDDLSLDSYKTKDFIGVMQAIGVGNALFAIAEPSDQVLGSARNLPSVKVLPVIGVNVYDILRHENLVLTLSAIKALEERLCS